MKKAMMIICGGLVLAFFANCGKNDSNQSAPAGMSDTCYLMQTSSGAGTYNYMGQANTTCNYNYSALSAAGFSQANTTSNGAFGYTSTYNSFCSGSQAVVYSPSKGLGCVDSTRLNLSGQVATYTLNTALQTFVLSSAPNPYAQQGYGYNGTTPYGYPNTYNTYNNYGYGTTAGVSQVLRVCDAVEICPSGQTCRSPVGPTSYNPGVGICYF